MKTAKPAGRKKPGRPLSFDPEAALTPAMLLFWRRGYEATSLADLTQAMGVTPPSIYAAYGDKKGLFRAAVRRYLTRSQTPLEAIAQALTAEEAARGLMEGAAIAYTGDDTPAGCLLASSAIAVSDDADDLREELAAIRRDIEAALRGKIEAGLARGELSPGTDAAVLAGFIMGLIQGFSTLARDGATRAKLLEIARFAMAQWPKRSVRDH